MRALALPSTPVDRAPFDNIEDRRAQISDQAEDGDAGEEIRGAEAALGKQDGIAQSLAAAENLADHDQNE